MTFIGQRQGSFILVILATIVCMTCSSVKQETFGATNHAPLLKSDPVLATSREAIDATGVHYEVVAELKGSASAFRGMDKKRSGS